MDDRRGCVKLAHTVALFVAAASLFFLAIGKAPIPMFHAMLDGSVGSGFALSETLVKASPIVLCALATALPAMAGLVSVGAEGQLFAGSITGTAFVLCSGDGFGPATLPLLLIAGAAGGAAYGALAGLLRARLRVNETLATLLLNYLTPLFVDYLVYGPWKDPNSLGWPSTVSFPDAARLPSYFDTRVHLGLFLGVSLVLVAAAAAKRTRLGLAAQLIKASPTLSERAGLSQRKAFVLLFALGGAAAGIAGIAEASVVEGRLQSGVGAGAGYAGFLVAFLSGGHLLRLLPFAFVVAALTAAGDNLQLVAGLPSSVVFVLEGLLFACALAASSRARHSGQQGDSM
jgi:simple sugar transport system permease protein